MRGWGESFSNYFFRRYRKKEVMNVPITITITIIIMIITTATITKMIIIIIITTIKTTENYYY